MPMKAFPVIDLAATGNNIRRLRLERGLTVRDLQITINNRKKFRPGVDVRAVTGSSPVSSTTKKDRFRQLETCLF